VNPSAQPADGPSLRTHARIALWIGRIALASASLVAVAVPVGYFWLSYTAEVRESSIAARLHAAFITQVITQSTGDWRKDVGGLIETNLAPGTLPEQRVLEDLGGRTLQVSGPAVATPWVTTEAALAGLDGPVGRVVVHRSLVPLLIRTALVGFLGLACGLAIYFALRVLPLRALENALRALRLENALRAQQLEDARTREQVEQHLRIVYDHAIEGILMFAHDGRVASVNSAAAAMFGIAEAELIGRPLATLLRRAAGNDQEAAFDVGHFEGLAPGSDGQMFPVDVTINQSGAGDKALRIALLRDITERKEHERRLVRLASYDTLTGLPNRSLFREQLPLAMARARHNCRQLALMFLDLDRFKVVNDGLGHDVGDRLLQEVANRLSACIRASDAITQGADKACVYRLGGDEFTLLIENLADATPAAQIAQRIIHALESPVTIEGGELYTHASIGVAMYTGDNTEPDMLVKRADMAMYRAKDLGRGRVHFFSQELGAAALARLEIEASLHAALAHGDFHLHFQPKASLATGQVVGVEALLRWSRPGAAPIGPHEFVPILEEIGLIVPVGRWVLAEACRQMVRWELAGGERISLAVNLSPREFLQHDLLGQIQRTLAQTGFDSRRLEIELTESCLLEDSDHVLEIMRGLAEMGVRVAVDDFGTGESSLHLLKRFNVDTLKIDRSFVRDTPDDPEDCAISIAVIAMAHALNLKVVAEGVEKPEQAAFLQQHGCDEFQGYLLSPPLDPADFPDWLRQRARSAQEPVVWQAMPADTAVTSVENESLAAEASAQTAMRRESNSWLPSLTATDVHSRSPA